MTCEICGTGPIFAGNSDNHGHIEDEYHPCACSNAPEPTEPTDFDYGYDDCGVPGTAYDDFCRFRDAKYEGI